MAILGMAGCGSGDSDSDAPEVKVPLPTPPAPAPAPAPVVTPPPADKPCTYTTTPGAAATDTAAYVPAASEALNPNVIAAATVKPSVGGALQVKKIDCLVTLTDKSGKPIQLRGMSTAGLQWFPDILNGNAFDALNKDWGSNVVRLAMYVGEDGYATKPELFNKVTEGIDLAIANDLYVIVDWHVLTPGDPNADVYKGALEFFRKISQKYPNNQHIIYELANEPNSREPGVSNDAAGWAKVKSYATPIIKMLRDAGNKNLVIVGTPNWSQRPDLAADDPIDDANIMYTVHFYTGTHFPSNVATDRSNVMSNARYALEHGVGVFATEWGVSEASGDKGPYLKDADRWLDFLNKHNISWVNWNLSNNNETSSALVTSTALNPGDDHLWAPLELSLSGEYARNRIKGTAFVPIERPVTNPGPGTGTPFTAVANDFNDGTLGGWGLQAQSDVKTVTLSNDAGALKLTGMTASRDVSATNFWGNVRISGDSMTARPNLFGATTMTVDVIVDAATTVSIAAIPQSSKYGWANPTAVAANPANFVVQPNGKYKATISFNTTTAPNLKAIAEDSNTTNSTLTNVILFVGAQSGNTVAIDNITFTGLRPTAP